MVMDKMRLLPFLLLSFLIHVVVLTGINISVPSSLSIPELPKLIPVEVVLIERKPSSILTFKETEFLKDALVAEVQTVMGTPSATPMKDFPGPIPKKGTFRPSLNVEQIPTPGTLPVGHEGKEVESRRVVSRSLTPPLRLPAVFHSPLDQSPLPEVEDARVLTQAKKGRGRTPPVTSEKITAPLGRNRPHPEFVSDLLPIPTVKSPVLPDKEEMILEKDENLQSHISNSAALESLRVKEAKITPQEPLMVDFERRGTFWRAENGFSILLVLDTSGSVKGPPLEGIKKSALEFVRLLRKMDRCATMTFNDEVHMIVPFSSNKNLLRRKIISLMTEGRNTVMFDALHTALLLLKKEKNERRFIILFSDGKDEGSQSTPHAVINQARKAQIPVFSLGYSSVERKYLRTLENISRRTGGIFADAPQYLEIVDLFKTASKLKSKKK